MVLVMCTAVVGSKLGTQLGQSFSYDFAITLRCGWVGPN